MQSINPELIAHLPALEGVAKLFHPHVETVMHDLQSGKVASVYNSLTRQVAGERSAISKFVGQSTDSFPDIFEPYEMVNWDGKKFKCVSVTIRANNGHPIGIACFHFDTTVFRNINSDMLHLISTGSKTSVSPIEQFTDDWQERVNECIGNYLKENNTTLEALSGEQRRQAVNRLYSHGLFNYRKAAMYIGKRLGLSRATVYNYLKESKGDV